MRAKRYLLCLVVATMVPSCSRDDSPSPQSNASIAAIDRKTRTQRPPEPPTAKWLASLQGESIPKTPAAGMIHGQRFRVEEAVLNEGILKLREGEDFLPDRALKVFLFLDVGVIPEGMTFDVAPDAPPAAKRPHVHYSYSDTTKGNIPHTDIEVDNYSLKLEFGQENEEGLPGTIYVCLPDEKKSFVAGQFVAKIKGFRYIDGEPDLTSDSFHTLKIVTKRHLEKEHPGEDVQVVETGKSFYHHPGERTQTGFCEIRYTVGEDTDAHATKLLFAKGTEGWHVAATLRMDQVEDAHPLETPNEKNSESDRIRLVAARWLEADLTERFPGQSVTDIWINSSGWNKKLSACQIRYTLGDEKEPRKRRIALRNETGTWTVTDEIPEEHELNFKSGRIEPKK